MKFKKIRENNCRRQQEGRRSVPGRTKRKPILIEDIPLNGCLINCRSVKPKLNFLSECFKINKLDVALLNETWLYKNDPQGRKLLLDLKNEHSIDFIRKDRNSRGGGVAVAFDRNRLSLKKLNLQSLRLKNEFEILATRGQIKNCKKELTIFSCYLPPKLSKIESTSFLDVLTDAISEAKSTSDGWLMIGGDWNNRSLGPIFDLFPDIKQIITPPTRKDRTLDVICTNFISHVKKAMVCSPLEGKLGQKSDHKIVLFESKLPRPAAFSWETHEYLRITESGKQKFIADMNSTNWRELEQAWPDVEKMTEVFHGRLGELMNGCFAWKKVRRKSNNKPWMTDSILERIEDRKKIFRREGRSELFNRLNKGIQKTIRVRKKKCEENMLAKLEQTGKTNQWYSIYKFLSSEEMPDRWEITQLDPDVEPFELSNNLAVHFGKITNKATALDMANLPQSLVGQGLIPQLDTKNVKETLESFKKCNSRVDGDIPRELVTPCSVKLSEALTLIYNACLLSKSWPSRWKVETIIPIPKTISPGSFDDIRPISMTTLWSKILESYVSKFTLDETMGNWKKNQYGVKKGASTDHVLVALWDKILTGLDNGSKAVVLSGIDFSKSFSRCSHQEILKSYARLGLSD